MKEETGYDVRVNRLAGIYSSPPDTTVTYPNGDVVAYVNLCFECIVTRRRTGVERRDIRRRMVRRERAAGEG